MPTRVIRDGYLGSERVTGLGDWAAEVLYLRLYLCADDLGRFDARPRYVLSQAYPVHDEKLVTESMVKKWLLKLAAQKLILLYKVGGREFLYIAKFGQRLRHMRSKYPAPPADQVAEIDADELATLRTLVPEAVGPLPPLPPAEPNKAAQKRLDTRAAAVRVLEYLNLKAGTQYQAVDGTLKLPIARLNSGATEEQMKAVIDAKVAEVLKGDFKREWLQPSTLFNGEKYPQYVGKLKMGVMETNSNAEATKIIVRGTKDGTPGAWALAQKDMPDDGEKPTAKETAQAFWSSDAHRKRAMDHGCDRISVKVPGETPAEFTVAQLEEWKNGGSTAEA